MIIANENELLNPMVTVPLWQYEDGVRAITKLEIVTDLAAHMNCDECSCMMTLKRVLGLCEEKGL